MPESDSSLTTILMILLPLALLLLFVVFLIVARISARLRRIEHLLQDSQTMKEEEVVQKREMQKREKSQFEEFLNEDGKRRMMSKREQSEAFREWRRQHGKTWSTQDKQDD